MTFRDFRMWNSRMATSLIGSVESDVGSGYSWHQTPGHDSQASIYVQNLAPFVDRLKCPKRYQAPLPLSKKRRNTLVDRLLKAGKTTTFTSIVD